MKGGTSLRPDGRNRRPARSLNVASSMDICYLTPAHAKNGGLVPRTSLIRRFVRAYRVSRPPPITYRSLMLRTAPTRNACKTVTIATAAAMALAPVAAQAQGGLPILRDAETEQLLRDYTRPILRVAGLEKQNIQMVIINDALVQRVRCRRPPHLRQLGRDDAVGDAEPDHRRARARNRPPRRRPSRQDPRAARQRPDPDDHRHAARRRRARGRLARRQRQ